MSEACIWRQKQNAFTASAMWPSGHTDVSEGVSPYMLAVVCPCRSAEPRSHSCWSGWLWSSASPGPAADWDTNTAQRLLANAQWNPHVSYNARCSQGWIWLLLLQWVTKKNVLVEVWYRGSPFGFLNHIGLVSEADMDDWWSKSARFTVHLKAIQKQ